jgi:NADP-reducing hydrogenase subunit HndC
MMVPSGEIRVAMDSGGIAAGASAVFETLRDLCALHPQIRLVAVGTPGMCYADPQIEVLLDGRANLHIGKLTPLSARLIFNEFVIKGHMPAPNEVHDYLILGSRNPGHALPQDLHTIVCADTMQAGDEDLLSLVRACVPPQIDAIEVSDFGFYNRKFVLQFFPGGLMVGDLSRDEIAGTVHQVLSGGMPKTGCVIKEPAQLRIASRNCGVIDPESLPAYTGRDGYAGLKRALNQMTAHEVVAEISMSGLRGRGGAGFPTGKKWQLTAAAASTQKYVICNGDEGDPGAFMDRSLLESDPHTVLEGLILAAYAVGADTGYFYIRAEYPLAIQRVQQAVADARAAGYLGENILGSNFSFEVHVRLGAGAYVCGEETALIASIEGKRGSPHARPPYPSEVGLHGAATCINNVETLASVPEIVRRGGAWYAAIGDGKSAGTKVFAVSGRIRRTQLVEVPMGIGLRQVVFDLCGGLPADKQLKAVQTGGPSGGLVPEHLTSTPLTYEAMAEVGSIIGSGGMIILDNTDSMVKLMRFYLSFNTDESCGKCAPCRIGGFQLAKLYDKLLARQANETDLAQITRIANAMKYASLCGLGKAAPSPLFATFKYFRHEYEELCTEVIA